MKKRTIWSEQDIQFIKDNHKLLQYKEIGQELGINFRAVAHKAKKLGLKKKHTRPYYKLTYKTNEHYFDQWTENSAYIAGFLTADGHISTSNGHKYITVGLAKKDEHILKFLCNEISLRPIRFVQKTNAVIWTVHSKLLVNKLVELGLPSDKKNITIHSNIPTKYKKDYMRGLFDGDGCLTYSVRTKGKYVSNDIKFSIVNSNYELLQCMKNEFNYGNIARHHSDNCYAWLITNYKEVQEIYHYMYSSVGFYLARKRQKFIDYFGVINDSYSRTIW